MYQVQRLGFGSCLNNLPSLTIIRFWPVAHTENATLAHPLNLASLNMWTQTEPSRLLGGGCMRCTAHSVALIEDTLGWISHSNMSYIYTSSNGNYFFHLGSTFPQTWFPYSKTTYIQLIIFLSSYNVITLTQPLIFKLTHLKSASPSRKWKHLQQNTTQSCTVRLWNHPIWLATKISSGPSFLYDPGIQYSKLCVHVMLERERDCLSARFHISTDGFLLHSLLCVVALVPSKLIWARLIFSGLELVEV